MPQGFRFQSATVLVNASITKSLFIVLSKCLLLAQFCLAHVLSHGHMQCRVDKIQKLCLKRLGTKQILLFKIQIQILPLNARSVL